MSWIVNGERIEDAAINAEAGRIEQARKQGGGAGAEPLGRPSRDLAVEQLVGQVLLRQEARRSGEVAEREVEEEFQRVVASCGGIDNFRQRYQVSPGEDQRFRKHIAEGLRLDRLIERSGFPLEVGEHEMSQYYASHFDDFMTPAEVRASHIVRNPQNGDPDEVYEKMCLARRELAAGADFAAVAAKYSECRSEPGGDLGFFSKGQMVEGFEAVVFSMEVGEISPVFMTQFGFHVAKVTDRRAPRRKAYEEVRGIIRGRIMQTRRDEACAALVGRLRQSAVVREEAPSVGKSPAKGKDKGRRGKRCTDLGS